MTSVRLADHCVIAVRAVALTACLAVALSWAADASAQQKAAPLGVQDLNLINRVTWGVSASSAQTITRLGADRFLEEHWHPPAADRLPPAAQVQIDAMTITRTPLETLVTDLDTQIKTANAMVDPDLK